MPFKQTRLAFLEDNSGSSFTCDTIEHEGQLWLVPEWLDTHDQEWLRPARLILLSALPHQAMTNPEIWRCDYLLNFPISRAVFHGRRPPQASDGLVVLEAPGIRVAAR